MTCLMGGVPMKNGYIDKLGVKVTKENAKSIEQEIASPWESMKEEGDRKKPRNEFARGS